MKGERLGVYSVRYLRSETSYLPDLSSPHDRVGVRIVSQRNRCTLRTSQKFLICVFSINY